MAIVCIHNALPRHNWFREIIIKTQWYSEVFSGFLIGPMADGLIKGDGNIRVAVCHPSL
jgi:hypothetical protein